MTSRTLIILAVLGLLYYLWSKRKGSSIVAGNEWAGYTPSRFRVVDGGMSIVGVDDK